MSPGGGSFSRVGCTIFGVRTTNMGILDNAKEVAKAVEEIHNLELYQRVLGLTPLFRNARLRISCVT